VSNDEVIHFEDLEGETELTPPEIYASNLIEWAVERHASDLFVSDSENSVIVAVRRLGRVEPVRRLARDYGHRLQGHLRVLAGADAGEIIRPAEGRGVLATPNGHNIDLRLSCMPTLFGQDVAIRLFDPVRGARSIDKLGFDPVELQTVRDLIAQPSGLILVAGPTGSGKSSTLYAAVAALNDGTRKIHTLEDPIEHSVPGVMQSQINLRAGLDFAELLAAVLRHSPDVIMIGEIRDARTAETAVRAGTSGQLVLATIHAKTAAEAVDSMLHFESNPKFVARSLLGVINQRLIRHVCPECRQPLDVGPLEVSARIQPRLGDLAPTLCDAPGCEHCFGDGFTALTCVPEILTTNREFKDVISGGAPASVLEDAARDQGMLLLWEAVALRVYRGQTTAEEAHRAVPDPLLASLAELARGGQ
jgi:type IV pilus assembly protein PilB